PGRRKPPVNRGYKGLTTCVKRITHWVIRLTRRLCAKALKSLAQSESCAIIAQDSGNINNIGVLTCEEMKIQKTLHLFFRQWLLICLLWMLFDLRQPVMPGQGDGTVKLLYIGEEGAHDKKTGNLQVRGVR
ncbi:MAG: hypothetical protein KJ919_11520, partial [Verrucomicrobia bacterium]|nr:hypothetical protein [Verrucomicrobiota bacterium]